ncbi:MAG: hypothetical protein FH751_10555 [Firmicutes bacterium]|nr:hypothetical protein [Bacillota bacterium]
MKRGMFFLVLILFLFMVGCNQNEGTKDTFNENLDSYSEEDSKDIETSEKKDNLEKDNEYDNKDNENSLDKLSKREKSYFKKYLGKWLLEEDKSYLLEIDKNMHKVGIEGSEYLSFTEFEIKEININEGYIILKGMRYYPTDSPDEIKENAKKEEVNSKIFLYDEKSKLKYVADYNSEDKVISIWIKSN